MSVTILDMGPVTDWRQYSVASSWRKSGLDLALVDPDKGASVKGGASGVCMWWCGSFVG